MLNDRKYFCHFSPLIAKLSATKFECEPLTEFINAEVGLDVYPNAKIFMLLSLSCVLHLKLTLIVSSQNHWNKSYIS